MWWGSNLVFSFLLFELFKTTTELKKDRRRELIILSSKLPNHHQTWRITFCKETKQCSCTDYCRAIHELLVVFLFVFTAKVDSVSLVRTDPVIQQTQPVLPSWSGLHWSISRTPNLPTWRLCGRGTKSEQEVYLPLAHSRFNSSEKGFCPNVQHWHTDVTQAGMKQSLLHLWWRDEEMCLCNYKKLSSSFSLVPNTKHGRSCSSQTQKFKVWRP